MSKTIFQKDEIDFNTKEIKKSTVVRATKLTTESFMRMYTQDLSSLLGCSNAEKNILFSCFHFKFIIWETNELLLNKRRRQEIIDFLSISASTFNCSISRLSKKGVIHRIDGRLILNPKLFFFGSDIGRMNTVKLTLEYHIDCEYNEVKEFSTPQNEINE